MKKRSLTLKEQAALYAAKGKVVAAASVLREVRGGSNGVVESPHDRAVRRYYSSSSASSGSPLERPSSSASSRRSSSGLGSVSSGGKRSREEEDGSGRGAKRARRE